MAIIFSNNPQDHLADCECLMPGHCSLSVKQNDRVICICGGWIAARQLPEDLRSLYPEPHIWVHVENTRDQYCYSDDFQVKAEPDHVEKGR